MTRSKELDRMGDAVVEALKHGRVIDAVRIFLRGVREEWEREMARTREERIWREIERLAHEQKARRNRPEDWH